MQTIGPRWPRDQECEDHVAVCAYCATPYPRSKLRRDGANLLVCPRHGDGADKVTLSQANAAGAAEEYIPAVTDGGEYPKITAAQRAAIVPLRDLLATWSAL